ncbi:cytochrome P450 [Ascobolus immersus RN42]|uniref:Cytochrome P450 n=1 Tax=Ascobolus immersus RN42 TaxID=1160509 RepID=A0A3N4I5X5_ASCIM|nr:cytochrome P450 [Ascobolus immersus RN42]
MSNYLLFLAFIFSYGVYRLITTTIESRKLANLAEERGCKPEKRFDSGFLGLSRFRLVMKHAKAGTVIQFITARFQEKKTWSVNLFGKRVLGTCESENIKAMLAMQFEEFALEYRKVDFNPLLGDGIFNSDGKVWHHSRALLRPQFSRTQISDLDALEVHVQRFMKLIPTDGTEIDIQDLIYRLTIDSATEFLFGKCTEALLSDDGNASLKYGDYSFARAFSEAQEWCIWRLRLGVLSPIAWLIPSYSASNKAVHKIMDRLIASCLAEMKHNPQSLAEKEYNPTDGRYIFLHALAHDTQDPRFLKDQLLNILLAGRDTTAVLITWTLFSLARNPDIYRKIRKEILTHFGTGTEKISFESLKNCTYLRYTLQETLRLFPPVPINSRLAIRNTTLPRGGGPDESAPVIVPKGQLIHYYPYELHRRKEVFGPDAEEFLPDRWDPSHPSYRKIGGWDYVPFNGGPRICLGQQFALTEAGYVVARLVQRIGELGMEDKREPVFAPNMTMPSARPVMMSFREA